MKKLLPPSKRAIGLLTSLLSAFVMSVTSASAAEFSEARLQRIKPAMQAYVDAGKLAGTMTLIATKDDIAHFSVTGMRDRENQLPLERDTIFRIYSMTKPVTAVAALTLWEQGKFHMFDPVSMYLPELKELEVYVSGSGENMVTEKANAPIRIIDLFLHTAGFSYGFTDSEVDKLYKQKLMPDTPLKHTELLDVIASLPLAYQPGTKWHYSISIDVLGLLVERISGQKLGHYMEQQIFKPLGMRDTGFYVPADKVARFAQVYTVDKEGKTVLMENEPLGDYLTDPDTHNAGGGLVSTIDDYLIFARMLLNHGEYNGVRILSRKTVEYMRSNHLPPSLVPFNQQSQGEGYGLSVSVTVDPDQSGFLSSKGNYGWGGMASTYFRIDPQEEIILLAMAQFVPIGYHRYHDDFRNLVYQALE